MKLRYFLCALLIGAFTILQPVTVAYGTELTDWPTPPNINSGNAILIDADTGEILYEKAAYDREFPASTTKIITALLTIENCNMSDTVVFSYEAAQSYTLSDSNIGIRSYEELTVEQTLRAILMESANEACFGIGEFISGSESAFVELMNNRAKELGAIDTNFVNTNGLHDNYHYTTCYDLAMIGRACFDNSLFISICSDTQTYEIAPTNKYKDTRYLRNQHALLENRSYYYEYALGGKTGYTEESGHTLISFAKKDGVRLICVVMNSTNDFRYQDTTALFEYGFNNFEKTALTTDTLNSFIEDSSNTFMPDDFFASKDYSLVLSENMYALLPIGASPSDIEASCTFDSDGFANITFTYNDHILANGKVVVSQTSGQVDSNLPLLTVKPSSTQKSREYDTINFWYLVIIFSVVVVVIFVIAYLLIMNKTEYGIKKKRDRMRRRRRK